MNSNLTVGDCRRLFGDLFSTDGFIPLMNQALSQLTESGRWRGSLVYVAFDGSLGFITLPYEYLSIMGVSIGQWPVPVFSQFHPYIESGPGLVEDTEACLYYLSDLGDGYATLRDFPSAGCNIQVTIGGLADNNKTIRFYGLDTNGNELYDANGRGFNLTTAGLNTISAVQIDSITGIEMPLNADGSPSFVFPWFLYALPSGGGLVTLGEYFPADTRPSYRRYQTGVTTQVVTALCQRRVIPVYKETDWVYPPSARAVKSAMQAVQSEDANNYQEVAQNWAVCYDSLNRQVHNSRGAAKPELNYTLFGGGYCSFPDVN